MGVVVGGCGGQGCANQPNLVFTKVAILDCGCHGYSCHNNSPVPLM